MTEQASSSGSPFSQDSGGSGDGLDETNWQILRDAVIAASRGDADAMAAATRRFDTDVPVDGRAGTYIWWLLRHRVAQLLGRRPGYGDISQIAGYAEARFGAVVRDADLLKNVLLTVWNLAAVPQQEVTGGQFLVAGVAALGVLLRDPAADLEAVRPDLAAWWRANIEKIRADGILEDRSRSPQRP